jgi:uncharacterized membrane protein YjgN (DUF898 family)
MPVRGRQAVWGHILEQTSGELVREDRALIQTAEMRVERFTFTGNASEYFRIWIVNLFLTIITIGIYSPWAKVRRLKYFYGNTWLDGHNFDHFKGPRDRCGGSDCL